MADTTLSKPGTVQTLANAMTEAFNSKEIDLDENGEVDAYELNEFLLEQEIINSQLDETQTWNLAVSVIETITGQDAGNLNEIPTEHKKGGASVKLGDVDKIVDVFATLDTNNCGNHDNNEIGTALAALDTNAKVVKLNQSSTDTDPDTDPATPPDPDADPATPPDPDADPATPPAPAPCKT